MLEKYYPVHTYKELTNFFQGYVPLIKNQLALYEIDIEKFGISGDHLGLQTVSSEEFDLVHSHISRYAETIKQGVIHERRNNTYRLNSYINVEGLEIQSIEMFEPKPLADISKLKPGIEHIAMYVKNYDELLRNFNAKNLPVDKIVDFGGSKFFKTTFINLIEIEFRNDYLWEALLKEAIS